MRVSHTMRPSPTPCPPTLPGPPFHEGTEDTSCWALLGDLLRSSILVAEDWESLPDDHRDDISRSTDQQELLDKLVEYNLLTHYQSARINAGKTFGLVLGNYRVLDRLGSGGMGIVFKGEHLRMRRHVAIKVLPLTADHSARDVRRFYAEMRAIAKLEHPNIVHATDAGETWDSNPESPILYYYVMEFVEGTDLEAMVHSQGPLSHSKACDLIYQIASALAEAHKQELVHRDIKPSNILVTPDGQAKLLDFGLVHHFRNPMTEPGIAMGTVDYMAPEQAIDASTVDIRADIYSLGGTLYWCLTAQEPFPGKGPLVQQLSARQHQLAPSVRAWYSGTPPELDAVVARMMAPDPTDRYGNPQAVMNALLPFIKPDSRERLIPVLSHTPDDPHLPASVRQNRANRVYRVLIVDDESAIRYLCRHGLQTEGIQCEEAPDGEQALTMVAAKPYDLVLLDVAMPGMDGFEVCAKLRENSPSPHMKVIMFSGHVSADDLAQVLAVGADDYLSKPFTVIQMRARIKAALRLKDAQDRADLLNQHLLNVNQQLEQSLTARDSDLIHARNALVLAMAKLVECRDAESSRHLVRLQRYSRRLAEEASGQPAFAKLIDASFIATLESCVPLHDIGKVGLPDHILLKEGRLDADERIIMQTHATIGSDTLLQVARQHGSAVGFLQMAIDITRHHHERFDGQGYPDRLRGDAIPLAARIVTVCDVYDALRSRRGYKPSLSHSAALQLMTEVAKGQFDPLLLQVFQRCSHDFDRIYRELSD